MVTGPRLILVRHGQTDANLLKALDSRPPGMPLNEAGREQARRAAERLAGEPVVAVYASVAPRAQQTAAPIAARHGLEVTVVEDVQEIFCGDFEGRHDHEARTLFDATYQRWVAGELDRRMPGGESAAEVRDRMLRVLSGLLARHADRPDGTVVVVSHGGAIQVSARAMTGEYDTPRYVPNTGRVALLPVGWDDAGAPSGWKLERWDTAHDAGVADLRGDVTGGAGEPREPGDR
jgi:broad specificity phosphatase PhoE